MHIKTIIITLRHKKTNIRWIQGKKTQKFWFLYVLEDVGQNNIIGTLYYISINNFLHDYK